MVSKTAITYRLGGEGQGLEEHVHEACFWNQIAFRHLGTATAGRDTNQGHPGEVARLMAEICGDLWELPEVVAEVVRVPIRSKFFFFLEKSRDVFGPGPSLKARRPEAIFPGPTRPEKKFSGFRAFGPEISE